MDQLWLWVRFNAFVPVALAVDLFVLHTEAHEVSLREAAAGSHQHLRRVPGLHRDPHGDAARARDRVESGDPAGAQYFLLAGVIHKFHNLKLGLSVALVFVGAKMLLVNMYKIPVSAPVASNALKRHPPEDAG